MADKLITALFALGVGVLMVGSLFTPVLDFTTSDTVQYLAVDNQSTEEVSDSLNISALDVNASNATIELENTDDFTTTSHVLNETESRTFNLSGASLNVNLTAIESGTTTKNRIVYPPTFGMNDGAAVFFNNLDTIIAGVGFIFLILPLVVLFT